TRRRHELVEAGLIIPSGNFQRFPRAGNERANDFCCHRDMIPRQVRESRERFRRMNKWMLRPIAVAVGGCFAAPAAFANPTGPQVVNGAVSMVRPDARTLNVTNSPGAIINWQGFSIGAGEVTRFIQQSSSSAVL